MIAKGFATAGSDSAWHTGTHIVRQRGAVLLALLLLVVLVSLTVVANDHDKSKPSRFERGPTTARSLSDAKQALVAWAVTLPTMSAKETTPGLLPFPDRNRDGNFDGRGDCVTFGLSHGHLLGRLPWAGDTSPCPRMGLGIDVRDGTGEPLWYAVSRNLLVRGRSGPVNPGSGAPGRATYPWIRLRDGQGRVITDPVSGAPLAIAAVIIAPGEALEGQDRSGPAPGPAEFLDTVTIGSVRFDNADADGCADVAPAPCVVSLSGEEFIDYTDASVTREFNDRVAYISVEELMRAVEKRVLGEVAIAMDSYRNAYGAYPWLAGFGDPVGADFKSNHSREGLLAVHLPNEAFSTHFNASWRLVDTTPTTGTWNSGDARLVPPLADMLSGSVEVTRAAGRCIWSDRTRAQCTGSRTLPAFYRADLDEVVTRTVEVVLAVIDASPRVINPASNDVRRRSLTGSPLATPISAPVASSIRITDYDAGGWGQRELVIDSDTAGAISLDGIRFELSVVYDGRNNDEDELPEWLIENQWHRFIYVAISEDAVPGGDADGDGNCATPLNTCLTLKVEGRTARSDIRALVLSSGARRAGQDRSIGDCDGDGNHDDYLCAYLEGDNSDKSTPVAADTYARDRYSAWFNDQLRVVAPLPP